MLTTDHALARVRAMPVFGPLLAILDVEIFTSSTEPPNDEELCIATDIARLGIIPQPISAGGELKVW